MPHSHSRPRAAGGSGSGGGASSGGGTGVAEEVSDVLALEGLGEEAGPVSFNGVAGGGDDLVQFLFSDFELSVVEEERCVGASEFIVLGLGEG